jgi:hypothetical protein
MIIVSGLLSLILKDFPVFSGYWKVKGGKMTARLWIAAVVTLIWLPTMQSSNAAEVRRKIVRSQKVLESTPEKNNSKTKVKRDWTRFVEFDASR